MIMAHNSLPLSIILTSQDHCFRLHTNSYSESHIHYHSFAAYCVAMLVHSNTRDDVASVATMLLFVETTF